MIFFMKQYRLSVLCILLLAFAAACSKTEEPPKPVGDKIPYHNTTTRKLAALLDSIPEASVYRAALGRTQVQHYMDSLAAGNSNAYYTLFVPTNKAWAAAGYTMNNINTVPVAELDTIIRYLAVPGGLPAGATDLFGETTCYPLMDPDRDITRSQVPSPFQLWGGVYYYYRLIVGMTKGTLRLNGLPVGHTPGIPATNGVIFMIDSLVTKPFYESYQVLNADTSFSFYMAALKKSNDLYLQKGLLGPEVVEYNDTISLVLKVGGFVPGNDPFSITFAPDNNAFRKAGFNSIAAINQYIDQSAIVAADPYTPMLTNMDSILAYHRIVSRYGDVNENYGYLYSIDLLNHFYNVDLSNAPITGALQVQSGNGKITVHRQDAPSGRGATIMPASDITTLTGVIHRVDNLLLPTP